MNQSFPFINHFVFQPDATAAPTSFTPAGRSFLARPLAFVQRDGEL